MNNPFQTSPRVEQRQMATSTNPFKTNVPQQSQPPPLPSKPLPSQAGVRPTTSAPVLSDQPYIANNSNNYHQQTMQPYGQNYNSPPLPTHPSPSSQPTSSFQSMNSVFFFFVLMICCCYNFYFHLLTSESNSFQDSLLIIWHHLLNSITLIA